MVLTSFAAKLTLFMFLVLVLVGNGIRLSPNPDDRMFGFDLDPSAKQIVLDLLQSAGPRAYNIKVYEGASNVLNAFAFGNDVIFINSAFFKYSLLRSGNYDLVTATIAHELGHRLLNSPESKTNIESRNEERKADYLGAWLLHKSNKGCELQVKLTGDLLANQKDISYGTKTHPSNIERYISAVKNCKALNETGKLPDVLYFEGKDN